MKYDNNKLNDIFDKTDGHCHICHKKLAFGCHGVHKAKGSWHVDHSIPRAKGGTDHLNNLYAACIPCNLQKNKSSNNTIRPIYGNTRAPYSKAKKQQIRDENTFGGAAFGALIGSVGGPMGALAGAVIGGFLGNDSSPKK